MPINLKFGLLVGQENVQEVLSKRLYLCQFLCALTILREGGHFTCKLFDVFTPFSVALIYLMRYAFDQVCVAQLNILVVAATECDICLTLLT